ncbi:MAG: hypothetical protein KGZ83_13385 [Sulfuricella sp.]|nr:hypothetical protein [Sulfuricella sp.]
MNITHNGSNYINVTEEHAQALGIPPEAIEAAKADERKAEIRRQCADKINSAYPVWKQINVMRIGTVEERDTMNAYIDACRAWSNGPTPLVAELQAIQP